MTLAVRYLSARTLDTAPAENPSPGPGEVEIAPAYIGICGTDLHIFHGDMDARVAAPAVLGHEMSGRIGGVGAGVTGWAVGDTVTVMPLRWDGTCPACRAGHQHICQNLDFIGIDSPGALQQRWNVPPPTLVRLPDGLRLDRPPSSSRSRSPCTTCGRAEVHGRRDRSSSSAAAPSASSSPWSPGPPGPRSSSSSSTPHRRAARRGARAARPGPGRTPTCRPGRASGPTAPARTSPSRCPARAGGVDTAVDVLGVRGTARRWSPSTPSRARSNLQRVFWRELRLLGARVCTSAPTSSSAVELVADGVIPAARADQQRRAARPRQPPRSRPWRAAAAP